MSDPRDIKTVDAITASAGRRYKSRMFRLTAWEGMQTLGGLAQYSERDLGKLPNVGRKTVWAVKQLLAEHGLALRSSNAAAPSGILSACGGVSRRGSAPP